MDTPRRGDTVILATMIESGRVVAHDSTSVTIRVGKRAVKVKLSRLECVDPDDGLWQEMEA